MVVVDIHISRFPLRIDHDADKFLVEHEQLLDLLRVTPPDLGGDVVALLAAVFEFELEQDRHDKPAQVRELEHVVVAVFFNGAFQCDPLPVVEAGQELLVLVAFLVGDRVLVVLVVEVVQAGVALDPGTQAALAVALHG